MWFHLQSCAIFYFKFLITTQSLMKKETSEHIFQFLLKSFIVFSYFRQCFVLLPTAGYLMYALQAFDIVNYLIGPDTYYCTKNNTSTVLFCVCRQPGDLVCYEHRAIQCTAHGSVLHYFCWPCSLHTDSRLPKYYWSYINN